MSYVTPPNFLWSDVVGTAESKQSLVAKLNILSADIVQINANLPAFPVSIANGGTGATDANQARTNLGLGSMALQNNSAVAITGGSINGATLGQTTPASASVTQLNVVQTGVADAAVLVGRNRVSNGYAYLDLAGDATYTAYGLRLIRYNTGANAPSQILHRGTGNLDLLTSEAAPIVLSTNTVARLTIAAAGGATFTSGATINTTGNDGLAINADANSALVSVTSYGGSSTVKASKANGTIASPTKVLANDFIGFYRWDGHDGSSFSANAGAQFYVQAPADWSVTSHPTRIIFQTTAVGAVAPSSALTLDSDQSASFNGAVIANAALRHTGTLLGFFNTTPAARQAQAALTGTPQAGTFATGTVTTPQLAGVVMNMIATLRLYGLLS